MSFSNKVFWIQLAHHSFLTKIHILFLIVTHSLSDKINSLLLMSNINLNRVSRNHVGVSFHTWKENILPESHCLNMASEDSQTISSDGYCGHGRVIPL